nr:MAG TPA: hypothetical protein [Caudoviricetes sp.]
MSYIPTKTYQKRRGLYILSPFAKPLTQRLINHPGHSSLFLLAVVLQMRKQISLDRNGLLDGFFGRIFSWSCHSNHLLPIL